MYTLFLTTMHTHVIIGELLTRLANRNAQQTVTTNTLQFYTKQPKLSYKQWPIYRNRMDAPTTLIHLMNMIDLLWDAR